MKKRPRKGLSTRKSKLSLRSKVRRTSRSKSRTKGKSVTSDLLSLQIGDQIWPAERDILFRPDRLKYVRKLIKEDGCVFCRAADAGVGFENLCLYQTEHSMVMMNKFPYNSGHILVLPKAHEGQMLKLSMEQYLDLQKTIRLSVEAIETIYQPAGFNLGMNHGAVAGAGIPEHLHYHIVPRWAGDLNFFPLIADTKVVVESLEASFDRLRQFFKGR